MGDLFFRFEKLDSFKNNEFIIYRRSQNEEIIYNYNKIVTLSRNLFKQFQNSGICGSRISVQCPHSPELCVILLSILNCGSSFCGIPLNANAIDICEGNKEYRAKYLVSHLLWEQIDSMKLMKEYVILDKTIYIFEILNPFNDALEEVFNECYSIKTSGSTGASKVVHVPVQSILPNIKSLSTVLKLTPNDIILLSSPITFDPFVVEYFLSLWNGAALLVTGSSIKLSPHTYADVLQCGGRRGATVAQMTPSLFRLFGLNIIRETLLAATTSLRILLLGGECFPSIDEIFMWTVNNNWQTRIFNIYGISEVSCWSTIYEIKRGETNYRIPLGSSIDSETELRVINDFNDPILEGRGYIQIGSASRKCIMSDECQKHILSFGKLFRSTDDIGSIVEGNIFYEGRKNDIVKRYGNRVDLSHITKTVSAIDGVVDACCVFKEKSMQLMCFIIIKDAKTKREIKCQVLSNLKNIEKPDDIQFVDHFPVTSHGKVSREDLLLHSFKNSGDTPSKHFERFIQNVLGINNCFSDSLEETGNKRSKYSLDLSFLDAGGTSFQALTLATQIELLLKRPEPSFLKMLLDGTTSIAGILESMDRLSCDSTAQLHDKKILNSNRSEALRVAWQYDTGKCVDATPACYNNVVSVGSHSRLLITLDATTGQKISSCILPDRIECQVCYLDDHLLLVGCYDGYLYAVDYVRGEIVWRIECEGMIKAKPLRKNNLVVIGNYSKKGNLVCVNINEKNVEWKLKIGSKGVFSSPVLVKNDSFVVCTLSGEVACIMFANGNITWKKKFQSPIFSTPEVYSDNKVIVAEVCGIVHALHTGSGAELWSFKSDGNIFSGILAHKEANHDYQIFFGCHDHRIYCLQSTTKDQLPSMLWSRQLNSSIYSTPIILYLRADKPTVLSCSTQGGVYILDYFTGFIIFLLRMNGEIFSSPCSLANRIYVGCRDNNLVCLEIQVYK